MAFTELTLVPKGYVLSNSPFVLNAPSLDQATPEPLDYNTPYAYLNSLTQSLKPFEAVCAATATFTTAGNVNTITVPAISTVAIGHLPYCDKAKAAAASSFATFVTSKIIGYAQVQCTGKDEAVSLIDTGVIVDYTDGAGAANVLSGTTAVKDMSAYVGWPIYLSAITAGALCLPSLYSDVQVGGPSANPVGYVIDDHRIYLYAIK